MLDHERQNGYTTYQEREGNDDLSREVPLASEMVLARLRNWHLVSRCRGHGKLSRVARGLGTSAPGAPGTPETQDLEAVSRDWVVSPETTHFLLMY